MRTFFAFLLFSVLLLPFQSHAWQQDSTSKNIPLVFKMEIKGDIDPRMTRYVKLALDKAHELKADYIVVEMDTYGGMVTDADNISSLFLNEETPLYVFINVDAASAGAMISISCDSIYMAPGASIGAATVVVQDGDAAPDKYQSYMRKKMRSAAEATGRNPEIAEGMVDQDIEVEGISAAGKVITFSTTEAIKYGYCEAEVRTIESIMARSKVTDYTLYEYELPGVETVIAFFLNPFVNGILILIIIGGIYFELQTPGVGFPIAASAIALILFLTPYYLHGLAESWEIILFFIGVGLLAVEIFVIPGFGVAGISGIILILGSLILMMLNNDFFDFSLIPVDNIMTALITTVVAFFGVLALFLVMGASLVNTVLFKRVALVGTQQRTEGYTATTYTADLVGKFAEAYTILRPSGKVLIGDDIKDAYTRGEYIDKGERVKILSTEGTSLRVRKATEEELASKDREEA